MSKCLGKEGWLVSVTDDLDVFNVEGLFDKDRRYRDMRSCVLPGDTEDKDDNAYNAQEEIVRIS